MPTRISRASPLAGDFVRIGPHVGYHLFENLSEALTSKPEETPPVVAFAGQHEPCPRKTGASTNDHVQQAVARHSRCLSCRASRYTIHVLCSHLGLLHSRGYLPQVRRSLKREEAARTASRAGQLRVVLGAAGGATRDNDFHHSSHAGWLETDVNTLDVTDPSDFT